AIHISNIKEALVLSLVQIFPALNDGSDSGYGIHPEAVDRLLVRKPKTSSRSGIKSTLYRAYTGLLPNNLLLSSVESLGLSH
ncbi:hypothetical protein cypCar_00044171, partial [Cyprinus carpio]